MKFDRSKMTKALRRAVQRMHYPIEVMLMCVRWYAGYPLSFRQIEEMMAERGVFVDHSTRHRWSMKILPVLAAAFCRRKRPVGRSWRMDETYVKVGGQWKCVPGGRPRWPDRRLPAACQARPRRGTSVLRTRQ